MELKSASEGNDGGGAKGNAKGKRNNYIKRLKKAVKHVKELEDLVVEICDETTKVEMNCYAAWMRGNHFCETRDWQVCTVLYCSL